MLKLMFEDGENVMKSSTKKQKNAHHLLNEGEYEEFLHNSILHGHRFTDFFGIMANPQQTEVIFMLKFVLMFELFNKLQ
ncbi:hypothetical protein B9Z55_025668 [Caenorhabditis nigoni]|uniref:Uncharacterized protein n=1 Tax=Caenorhabditis nigoni TaxID=1611254 RepID=A0A2G5T046_9PELO|nr:hypothetical protein B9Z55_025668 [Caenorhabditis nigoni]